MLTARHASVPEIRSPLRTVAIISVVSLGLGYLWWRYNRRKKEEDEKYLR